MKVVIPSAGVPVSVAEVQRMALEQEGLAPVYEPVGGDDQAYRELFTRLWQEDVPFVIVEHDIIPWPGAIEQLFECKEAWCGYGYQIGGRVRRPFLGCTKFEPRRLGALPVRATWKSPGKGRGLDHEIESQLAHRSTDTHDWSENNDLICHEHFPAVLHCQKYVTASNYLG